MSWLDIVLGGSAIVLAIELRYFTLPRFMKMWMLGCIVLNLAILTKGFL